MVDGDGDGHFSSARDYARILVARHGAGLQKLLPALGDFDEAISAQAASLCAKEGQRLDTAGFSQALESAPPQVKRGFKAYLATQQ